MRRPATMAQPHAARTQSRPDYSVQFAQADQGELSRDFRGRGPP